MIVIEKGPQQVFISPLTPVTSRWIGMVRRRGFLALDVCSNSNKQTGHEYEPLCAEAACGTSPVGDILIWHKESGCFESCYIDICWTDVVTLHFIHVGMARWKDLPKQIPIFFLHKTIHTLGWPCRNVLVWYRPSDSSTHRLSNHCKLLLEKVLGSPTWASLPF